MPAAPPLPSEPLHPEPLDPAESRSAGLDLIEPTDELVDDGLRAPPGRRIHGKLGCALTFVIGLACVGLAWIIMKTRSAVQLDATAELVAIVRAGEADDAAKALVSMGCTRAAVLPTEGLKAVAQRLENARAAKEKREARPVNLGTERTTVICAVDAATASASSVTCKDVATSFVGSVKHAALPIVAVVQVKAGDACAEEYTGDADHMTPVGPLELPPIFPHGE